jgi:hypothetical protein
MSKAFLYQINFNRKKYPEICDALEEAKADNGVAWYLRELIQKDIESRKNGAVYTAVPAFKPEPKIEQPEPKKVPRSEVVTELPDDSGGFL